jgi:replicative DNA helicase
MKLLSPELEKLVIKSITKGPTKVASNLMANLDGRCFAFAPTKEAWDRISSLIKDRGIVPSWQELLTDPVITEESRKLLKQYKKPVLDSKEKAVHIATRLHEYSKLRGIYDIAKYSAERVKSEKIDADELLESITNRLTDVKTSSLKKDHFLNWGTNSNSKKIVKKILYDNDIKRYIPTGFGAFDRVNLGFERSSLVLLGATSGGGKCLVGDTKVPTSVGVKTLKELWELSSGKLNKDGFNSMEKTIFVKTHKGKLQPITHTYKTKGKTIKITFDDGSILEGLPEHNIMINGSWKRLDEIAIGDTTKDYSNEYK